MIEVVLHRPVRREMQTLHPLPGSTGALSVAVRCKGLYGPHCSEMSMSMPLASAVAVMCMRLYGPHSRNLDGGR